MHLSGEITFRPIVAREVGSRCSGIAEALSLMQQAYDATSGTSRILEPNKNDRYSILLELSGMPLVALPYDWAHEVSEALRHDAAGDRTVYARKIVCMFVRHPRAYVYEKL